MEGKCKVTILQMENRWGAHLLSMTVSLPLLSVAHGWLLSQLMPISLVPFTLLTL